MSEPLSVGWSTERSHKYDNGQIGTPAGANEGGFIKYNAWSYSRQLIPWAPSGTQVIGTGIRGQILEGQPAFLPPNEKVKCFGRQSLPPYYRARC